MIAINTFGVILGLARREGAVPGIATYTATKHAVLGFTDTARLELRGTAVTLSAVLPTLTNTSMIDGVATMSGLRNAEPEEIAAGIAGLIVKPKPQRLTPLRVSEAVTHALQADSIFADAADKQERRDYEDRARHT
jgi:short-subunit dehydrogenase